MKSLDSVVKTLKKNNFVVIKNFFSKDVLVKIKKEIEALKTKKMNRRDKHYISVGNKLLLSSIKSNIKLRFKRFW